MNHQTTERPHLWERNFSQTWFFHLAMHIETLCVCVLICMFHYNSRYYLTVQFYLLVIRLYYRLFLCVCPYLGQFLDF